MQALQLAALVAIAHQILEFDVPLTVRASSSSPSHTATAPTSTQDGAEPAHASQNAYGRLVVMLVDALREDFVHEREEMRYVRSLLRDHSDVTSSFVAIANTPTVTMPRIKALMTGGVPKFIDLLNNINSKSLEEDNLISRLDTAGSRMVLYGDETWLKLFPNAFTRHDGTSSFFTKDYTEVDDNITRHFSEDFDPEFLHKNSRDWDVSILHYLGMDHIGHQHGPASPQMTNKLEEMDMLFETLHQSLQAQERKRTTQECSRENLSTKRCSGVGIPKPTLLVLASDHGMNKVGNHGGASRPETSAVLITVHVDHHETKEKRQSAQNTTRHMIAQTLDNMKTSESLDGPLGGIDRAEIAQVDLASTLGTLLGVGIPKNNVGKPIKDVFKNVPKHFFEQALSQSMLQLQNLASSKGLAADKEPRETIEDRVNQLHQALFSAGSEDSGASQESLNVVLLVAFGVLGASAIFTCCIVIPGVQQNDIGMIIAFMAHAVSLASSSVIENEYFYWFLLVTTWYFIEIVRHLRWGNPGSSLFAIAALILLRLLRNRLQVINFARLNDLVEPEFVDDGAAVILPGSEFTSPTCIQVTLILLGLVFVLVVERYTKPFVMLAFGLLNTLKGHWGHFDGDILGMSTVLRARLVYACVVCIAMRALYCFAKPAPPYQLVWDTFHSAEYILFTLLHRSEGFIVLLASVMTLRATADLMIVNKSSPVRQTLVMWSLGQCYMFALGNSHVASTVDISGAYTGLTEYNQVVVGLLTAIIVFTGPIMVTVQLARMQSIVGGSRNVLVAAASVRILASSIVLTMMRSHLFIWSVFAPKWLFEFCLFIATSVLVYALPGEQ